MTWINLPRPPPPPPPVRGVSRRHAQADVRSPAGTPLMWRVSADVEALAWNPSSPTQFLVSAEDGLVVALDARAGAGASCVCVIHVSHSSCAQCVRAEESGGGGRSLHIVFAPSWVAHTTQREGGVSRAVVQRCGLPGHVVHAQRALRRQTIQGHDCHAPPLADGRHTSGRGVESAPQHKD